VCLSSLHKKILEFPMVCLFFISSGFYYLTDGIYEKPELIKLWASVVLWRSLWYDFLDGPWPTMGWLFNFLTSELLVKILHMYRDATWVWGVNADSGCKLWVSLMDCLFQYGCRWEVGLCCLCSFYHSILKDSTHILLMSIFRCCCLSLGGFWFRQCVLSVVTLPSDVIIICL